MPWWAVVAVALACSPGVVGLVSIGYILLNSFDETVEF